MNNFKRSNNHISKVSEGKKWGISAEKSARRYSAQRLQNMANGKNLDM